MRASQLYSAEVIGPKMWNHHIYMSVCLAHVERLNHHYHSQERNLSSEVTFI